MGELAEMRDLSGVSTADVQAFYTATKSAFSASLLGSYVINGRTFTPLAPDKYLSILARLGNELLRRQIQPPSPDLGIMQAEFGAPL